MLHSGLSCIEHLVRLPRLLENCVATSREHVDQSVIETLEKVPQHIAFLLLEPKISCQDLAKLVFWSVSAKISTISFYDPRGKIKDLEIELLKEINERNVKLSQPLSIAWRTHGQGDSVIVSKGGKFMYPDTNGNNCDAEVTVSLLSKEDGKKDIVKVAQELSRQVSEGELSVKEISEDTISKTLFTNRGLPDPCLLVRFGDVASNGDFPPWQLRLTELHGVASHRGLRVAELEDVLLKFGRCRQRFGK